MNHVPSRMVCTCHFLGHPTCLVKSRWRGDQSTKKNVTDIVAVWVGIVSFWTTRKGIKVGLHFRFAPFVAVHKMKSYVSVPERIFSS